jgi:hypothetical protein
LLRFGRGRRLIRGRRRGPGRFARHRFRDRGRFIFPSCRRRFLDRRLVDEELELLQKRIAERLGFRLVDHRMELYGVAIDRDR